MSGPKRKKKSGATKRRRTIKITGGIVPRGALAPNPSHPTAGLYNEKERRQAFLDELAEALAELMGPVEEENEDTQTEDDLDHPTDIG